MADMSPVSLRAFEVESGNLPPRTARSGSLAVVLVMATLAVASLGCGTLELRAFDQDMPKELVKQYGQVGNRRYVDEGFGWIPFLRAKRDWVAKTEDGFSGRYFSSWGPLGIIQSQWQRSTWDSEGRLQRYAFGRGSLWGVLFEEWYGARKENERWVGAESFKILKGLLGYEIGSKGSVIAYFLYIPIPLRSGRGDDARAEDPPCAEEDPSPEPGAPE